jgi:hypothetical protein
MLGRCRTCGADGDDGWAWANLPDAWRIAPVDPYDTFVAAEALTWSVIGLACIFLTFPVATWQSDTSTAACSRRSRGRWDVMPVRRGPAPGQLGGGQGVRAWHQRDDVMDDLEAVARKGAAQLWAALVIPRRHCRACRVELEDRPGRWPSPGLVRGPPQRHRPPARRSRLRRLWRLARRPTPSDRRLRRAMPLPCQAPDAPGMNDGPHLVMTVTRAG